MSVFFEFPPTRSNRTKWALEELGIEYTSRLIDITKGEHHLNEYKEVNPMSYVPAYQTSSYTMFESVAIILQLLDEHPEQGLTPAVGTPRRAEYYQWAIFACSELDPVLSDLMKHTMLLPEDERNTSIAKRARELFTVRGNALSNALESREYLLGGEFSGVDIIVGYNCNWAAYTGVLKEYPVLMDYYSRLEKRPAFQKVFQG